MVLSVSSESPEDVIRFFLETAASDGRALIITNYDLESVITAGIIGKALRTLEIDFSIVGTDSTLSRESNVIAIKSGVGSCKRNCVEVQGGQSVAVLRRGSSSFIIKLPVIPEIFRRALMEYAIIPKEVRYLIIATILSKYTPRLKFSKLVKSDEELIRDAVRDGIIEVVPGLKLIGWGVSAPSNTLRYSVDVLVLKYFLSKESSTNTEVNARSIALALGFKDESELLGTNYIVKDEWVVKDLYQLAYTLVYGLDIYGIALSTIAMNVNRVTWLLNLFMKSLGSIKDVLEVFKRGEYLRQKHLYVINYDIIKNKSSLTVINKVLHGLKIISEDSLVVARVGNEYYIPLQLRSDVLAKGGVRVRGGYAVVSGLEVLVR